MGSPERASATFNSTRFLYSIASHTRVAVSVLKSDLDHRIHRKSSFQTPNNQQVVPSKRLSHARSEQQLKPLTKHELEQYSLTSAASPNAGSRQVGATRRGNSGCCYLCEVDDSQYQKQLIPESRRIHSAPLPESRRIHATPFPESRCIESHSHPVIVPKSRRVRLLPESQMLPESRRITATEESTPEAEPERSSPHQSISVSRSASLRKALAELDTNIIPTYSTTPISAPRRIRVKPLSLSFVPSSSSSIRPSPVREHNRRVSYAGQSFFFDNDDLSTTSPRTRRFPPKTPPQPFLLSPTRPTTPLKNSTVSENHPLINTQPPTPPLRRSSLLFRSQRTSIPLPRPPTLLLKLRLPSTLPLGSPSRALPASSLTSLTSTQKAHFHLLITLTTPHHDPLFTPLLQVATTEPCIRNLCLLVGQLYTEQEELRRWIDPVARNIDCARAVEVLMRWLRKGGREMEEMVGVLVGRLVRGPGVGMEGVGVIGVGDVDGGVMGVMGGMSGMGMGTGVVARGRGRGRCSVM